MDTVRRQEFQGLLDSISAFAFYKKLLDEAILDQLF